MLMISYNSFINLCIYSKCYDMLLYLYFVLLQHIFTGESWGVEYSNE